MRLGHGNDEHVRVPRLVEVLRERRVVQVAVGALHTLALTSTNELFSWGDNDLFQLGTGASGPNRLPAQVRTLFMNE